MLLKVNLLSDLAVGQFVKLFHRFIKEDLENSEGVKECKHNLFGMGRN